MINSLSQLGRLIKFHREARSLSQDAFVAKMPQDLGANRSTLAHLEQGLRLPKPQILQAFCEALEIPPPLWQPFLREESQTRFRFEEILSELIGRPATIEGHDGKTVRVVEAHIEKLFSEPDSPSQTFDKFNSVLLFYGVQQCAKEFVDHYFKAPALTSLNAFDTAVKLYQKDAIRLFSSFETAFNELNHATRLTQLLQPLGTRSLVAYAERSEWNTIIEIPNSRLPDLGYISAKRVRQEAIERTALQKFLEDLAAKIEKEGKSAIDGYNAKTRRRMDSLLRAFNTKLEHGLFSPLFAPDPDELRREAARLAPKTDDELTRMADTQETALGNLSNYIAADHLDVYVATSMRSDADFVSVNHFVRSLFSSETIRPLKLRYFNPTQSWIEDRIAKGLVEAIMLRRADVTIYMAQKGDTFGKDSEASVALGQGKPVIVYVPKLDLGDGLVDSEVLFRKSRAELLALLPAEDQAEVDDSVDNQSLVARILTLKLSAIPDVEIAQLVKTTWADFDLHSESERIEPQELRPAYRSWLDSLVRDKSLVVSKDLRTQIVGILVANAVRFEDRAKLFREIHPLALQVILSSGVLNGILVVRSIEQCAQILHGIFKNELSLNLIKDDQNYKLIEQKTGSTIRVISRHRLLGYGFQTFYPRKPKES